MAEVDGPYDLEKSLQRTAELLRDRKKLVVLTGAGISAESGVPTFRDAGGLWEGHRVEDVATPEAFARDPLKVWKFYNERRAKLRTVEPNPGHLAIVRLEQHLGPAGFTLISQNVDGLHRMAGSQNIIELHGNLARTRCLRCQAIEDRGLEELGPTPTCPRCEGMLRPDVVWFNEALSPDIWPAAMEAVGLCDAILVVGTSAVVYPANGLILIARQVRRPLIEINLVPTPASGVADENLFGPSGVVLPLLLERLGIA